MCRFSPAGRIPCAANPTRCCARFLTRAIFIRAGTWTASRRTLNNCAASSPTRRSWPPNCRAAGFRKVGGKLSEDQDGVTAAQINNLTLFAIQNGETILNYYMLFGGTNPGDWAARDLTTTYDYNAPIREWGGVGEPLPARLGPRPYAARTRRKARPRRSGGLRRDRAAKRCHRGERRAPDGGRYFFVRTSQQTESRAGTAHVKEKNSDAPEMVFDYQLEPFGSMIFYLPPGVNDVAQG